MFHGDGGKSSGECSGGGYRRWKEVLFEWRELMGRTRRVEWRRNGVDAAEVGRRRSRGGTTGEVIGETRR